MTDKSLSQPNDELVETIQRALDAATMGREWTNFDDVRCEEYKLVCEYDRLTESGSKFIVECLTLEHSHFIANAPEWLRALLEEKKRLQQKLKDYDGCRGIEDYYRVLSDLRECRGELQQVMAELAEKDMVLRVFLPGSDRDFVIRSILSQYKGESK